MSSCISCAGGARFEIGARQYQLKPKTLLIIPPGTHHQGFVDPSEDYERIVINFSPRDISPLLLEPLRHCPTALDVAGSELEELFDEFNLQEEKISQRNSIAGNAQMHAGADSVAALF